MTEQNVQSTPEAAPAPATNPAVVGQVDDAGQPVPTERINNAFPARNPASSDLVGAPSTTRTVKDLAQVMVDQWGHRGEFIRGMIIRLADLNPAHYDHEHALRVGAIRLLSEAEARVWANTASPTSPTNPDGSLDEEHQRRTRIDAGIPPDVPETVTGEQGPPEPAEFAKPTIPFTGNDQPAARPIRTRGKGEEG